MKHGKKYVDSFKAIDKAKQYDAPEALNLQLRVLRQSSMKLSSFTFVWALTQDTLISR